ncbi:cytochrome c and c1 heme-lyase [Pterulicium gracile]|uniref:Holocytochrome c-type synthase n=1 Tax=Pterulicium gracile TaxID=1884261 RepID=A0A5C3QN77_9AGAR|nr:cytochrome c and c1 heme-lyase [Pterula gracilis]
MGQSTSSQAAAPIPTATTAPAQCPVDHKALAAKSKKSAADCPVSHEPPSGLAKCPIDHDTINPLNQMPNLSQNPALNQTSNLPIERTTSSIPRDAGSKWDYPSPQQFYNALVRKGWETPEEHIETMVDIHNFLNEEAWNEVLRWEKRVYQHDDVSLAHFKGRPGEFSPKARFWMLAGWLLPTRFNNEPPFDRHDWVVNRPQTGEQVRYVIDYYSAPPEADGSPVFSLDVRPALDNFSSLKERISVATEEAWATYRAQNPPPLRTVTTPRD